MPHVPIALKDALAPITVISGHYGSGKTNFSVNLALDLADEGIAVTVIDLDIVNPYFRASEQRALLEDAGVELVAPVFAEAGTSLDVPSLTGAVIPALEGASADRMVIVDLGGDDVGAGSIGRFSRIVADADHAMLYVLNRHRNLMVDSAEAVVNIREIEMATRLEVTGLVDNSHLKQETDEEALMDEEHYALSVSDAIDAPLVAKTVPEQLVETVHNRFVTTEFDGLIYPIRIYVKNPWE